MSRLTELLSAVKDLNPKIGEELAREVGLLQQRTSYGLMFERHQPEAVELPGHPVRAGDKVRLLPPRGSAEPADPRLWVVQRARSAEVEVGAVIDGGVVTRTVPRYDAVLVAEFQDPIYPGLRVDETVVRGGDKPFHTVINGENFHALELLTFTHEHAVDVIYIDPPYNSGATDWKYNNDYVGTDDEYRHSKWLAFMERRLKLAKRLLRNDGVIVITIDEHEVIRLGGLLEQVFEGWKTQLVTIVSNPKGVTQEYFSRVEEYAFFVFAPEARIGAVDDDLLTHRDEEEAREAGQPARPRWKGLLRSGDDSLRADRKDMFYPIWIDPSTRKIARVGEPLPLEQEPDVEPVDGLVPVWPIRKDLKQGRWGVSAATLRSLVEQGFVAVGREDRRRRTWAVSYLSKQIREEIELGLLRVRGHDPVTGVADVEYVDTASRRIRTVWHRSRHDAGAYGKDLIGALLGGTRTFPFPKSLYAVEDALRPLVIARPEAVVLDFFAGSGTTAHAVMRLNRQDGGRRQCILVTNNEVSADEQEKLNHPGFSGESCVLRRRSPSKGCGQRSRRSRTLRVRGSRTRCAGGSCCTSRPSAGLRARRAQACATAPGGGSARS